MTQKSNQVGYRIGGASSWAPLSRIGVAAAVVASTTVCGMAVASASQSGVGETVASPIVDGSVSQLGVSEVVLSSATETPPAKREATERAQTGQLGVSATVASDVPKDDEKAAAEKKAQDDREDDRDKGAIEAPPAPATERQAPAPVMARPVQQAPVQQAPVYQAPVQPAPVYQAPASVRQAPAPAPAPAPAAPQIHIPKAPVVPQAPIAPKGIRLG